MLLLPRRPLVTEPSLDTTLETGESKDMARLFPNWGGDDWSGGGDGFKMCIVRMPLPGWVWGELFEVNAHIYISTHTPKPAKGHPASPTKSFCSVLCRMC